MAEKLINAIADMDDVQALALAKKMLAEGTDPIAILDDCRKAMEIVGKRFETCEYFISELILAGEILKDISAVAKPLIKQDITEKRKGKVLVGTVKGDIHDIGKDIVLFMLDINGFEVRDLGVDVPPETFVAEIKSFKPAVVALSGFLTLAYTSMKDTITAIQQAGLREDVKIMVGGGTIDQKICDYAGADAFGADAMAAVSLVNQWLRVN
jgi:5-methyltetrahydrofolate--homocysteine methyltransferase